MPGAGVVVRWSHAPRGARPPGGDAGSGGLVPLDASAGAGPADTAAADAAPGGAPPIIALPDVPPVLPDFAPATATVRAAAGGVAITSSPAAHRAAIRLEVLALAPPRRRGGNSSSGTGGGGMGGAGAGGRRWATAPSDDSDAVTDFDWPAP